MAKAFANCFQTGRVIIGRAPVVGTFYETWVDGTSARAYAEYDPVGSSVMTDGGSIWALRARGKIGLVESSLACFLTAWPDGFCINLSSWDGKSSSFTVISAAGPIGDVETRGCHASMFNVPRPS